jgi:hypothetical protein
LWPKSSGGAIAFIQRMDKYISPERARTLALQERSFVLTCAIISVYPRGQGDSRFDQNDQQM